MFRRKKDAEELSCGFEEYAFNMPSFYGDGMRFALTFRLDIWKRLSLSANLAHTHYWDRDLIGTDTEEISGSDKTDLYALLRWKF